MDLLMVLVELRRQEECSLAKQVHLFLFTLTSILTAWVRQVSEIALLKIISFLLCRSNWFPFASVELLSLVHKFIQICSIRGLMESPFDNFSYSQNVLVFNQSEMRLQYGSTRCLHIFTSSKSKYSAKAFPTGLQYGAQGGMVQTRHISVSRNDRYARQEQINWGILSLS